MRLLRMPPSVASWISTIFLLSMMLAIVVDLRDRSRRRTALLEAESAYRQARITRAHAELWTSGLVRQDSRDDAMIQMIRRKAELARADEKAKKMTYDRLRKPQRRRSGRVHRIIGCP